MSRKKTGLQIAVTAGTEDKPTPQHRALAHRTAEQHGVKLGKYLGVEELPDPRPRVFTWATCTCTDQ